MTASAAAWASWLQQTTPNLGTSSTWEFSAVSCTSPSICMAVGGLSSSAEELLSETRGPSGWTDQPIPEPQQGSNLFGVACSKASACTAVGDSPKGPGTVPLAERWNGSSWTIQSAPAPAGVKISQLNSVSCPSPSRCLAVGDATAGGKTVPLAELWNGASWKIETTPAPAHQPVSELNGIACPSVSRCFSVGLTGNGSIRKVLAEAWNGKHWIIQQTPSAASGDGLNAVSCESGASCMAVGSGLAERWNGKKWTALKIARPSGSPAELFDVSCTKAGPCYAVGGNFTEGIEGAVAELWNGSRWSVQPVPVTGSADESALQGVSCTTATNCTAVGSYHDSTQGDRGLAEDFTIRWQDASPLPFNGVIGTGLNAVSCSSSQACVVVGTFETNSAFESFSQSWDGSTWTARVTPKPKITNLDSVSCPAASACTAVGDIARTPNPAPLAERWNGFGWTIQKTPAPAGANRAFLLSVSCPSRTSCFAVGFAEGTSGKQKTLAEHWNGKTWQLQVTPDPAGKQGIELGSVSCASASSCVAVGTFNDGTFAQAWNGKTWKATSAVPDQKGTIHSTLEAVSCPSATDCTAVGSTVRHKKNVPLAEQWNGKKWSPQPTVAPGGVIASGLSSVSCTAASACTATGAKTGSATSAIAETWTGRQWVMHQVGPPPGSLSTDLVSVSCNSPLACLAVGSYTDSSSVEQMLADQYS